MNYYNEFDPKAVAWLRQLIADKLIPYGIIDTRSITDIVPSDLDGFVQCHFFAGIGGWSLALQLAGWPEDRPVWTGSCPCQPFSAAGKQLGTADERHLWPAFFNLIRECRPEYVFGEQVANAIGKGWLDGVSADLESEGYACGATVLGAHSVGAPHIRQRLFWVADSLSSAARGRGVAGAEEGARCEHGNDYDGCRGGLGHPQQPGLEGYSRHGDNRHQSGRVNADTAGPASTASGDCGVGDYLGPRIGGRDQRGLGTGGEQMAQQEDGTYPANQPCNGREDACAVGAWSRFELIPCADGKARRIEPGLAPLAYGIPERVVRLRGYGNAIVPQVAASFIEAFLEIDQLGTTL